MRMDALAVAALCALWACRSAEAHEHMYLASNAPRGGAVVVDYDFARAFPLAELANAAGKWIGVDPSFNSLVADDPARSLYRLKGGTKVSMKITVIDPSVLEIGRASCRERV